MSSHAAPRLRQVGLRTPGAAEGFAVKLPPLNVETGNKNPLQNGLQGSAMTVPPVKSTSDSKRVEETKFNLRSPTRASHTSKSSMSVTSVNSSEMERIKRESISRENSLRQQIEHLRSSIDTLNEQIREKDIHILELQRKIEEKENYYKGLYERESSDHKKSRKLLQATEANLDAKIQECHTLQEDVKEKIEELRKRHEDQLGTLTKEKDQEILVRDQKLNKLKTQMADALCGNSMERQQQLDELCDQLKQSQEEVETMKLQMKSVHKSANKSSCKACESNLTKLQNAQKTVTEKDKDIAELQKMCSKFKNQLTRQDQLLNNDSDKDSHLSKSREGQR